ncbi:TatD family hydrolase [Longispora albida]|uniref:TatD family hydrolase n=1 Tax=Longispora albida TaxID=203523 RepID=UPI00036B6E7F|nr:TatD family hydrolase [Longispora albida]
MRIFDPHLHASARTTDDYEALHAVGVRALVEPASWLGQPRTSAASIADHFGALLGWEPFRASQYGIAHHCALGLNPREANHPGCAEILAELPGYLGQERVVAVGEVGYDAMTPAEDAALAEQVALARELGLPVLVHPPHRDRLTGLRRALDVAAESGIAPEWLVLHHVDEVTAPLAASSGGWLCYTVYPDAKTDRLIAMLREYGTERAMIGSAADWGRSDPLLTRATGEAMLAAGFGPAEVEQVLWHNPVACYGRSGRLRLELGEPGDFHAGNSIRRGSAPR